MRDAVHAEGRADFLYPLATIPESALLMTLSHISLYKKLKIHYNYILI
jgi:hypothetical protein